MQNSSFSIKHVCCIMSYLMKQYENKNPFTDLFQVYSVRYSACDETVEIIMAHFLN